MLSLKPLNTPCNFGSNHLESLRFFVRFRLSHNISQALNSSAPLGQHFASRPLSSWSRITVSSCAAKCSNGAISLEATNEVATPTLRGFCGLGTESGTEKFYKSRDSNISRDMPRYAKHSRTQDDSEI